MAGFNGLTHKYDVGKLLASVLSHKGGIMPGMIITGLKGAGVTEYDYELPDIAPAQAAKSITATGTPLRKKDASGRVYFMPVTLRTSAGVEVEMPNAAISFTGKKTIIKTPLAGANGTVKELITTNDYSIEIAAVVISEDGSYPESQVQALRDMWRLNESVQLICAITDIWIGLGVSIVLESVSMPEVGAFEDAQVIKFTAETDTEFNLIVE